MRSVRDKSYREIQNTHFMFNNDFRKSLALRGNVEKHDTARMAKDGDTVLRMRFARWVINLRTDSQYALLTAFFSHGNNGYMNAPHCYVVRIFPVF
jgi:hypothetical protein